MGKSIMQSRCECFFCGRVGDLEEHHIFGGTANRKLSEKYGLKVKLCREHHTGSHGVHFNPDMMKTLHQLGQNAFEQHYKELDFRSIFGKNYK